MDLRTVCLIAAYVALAGCLTNPTTPLPSASTAPPSAPAGDMDGRPDFQALPAELKALRLTAFGDAPDGVRLRLWDDRAYVATGSAAQSISIFDVSDPSQPERLGAIKAEAGVREGLDLLTYGPRVVVAGTLVGQVTGPIGFWDVTDPANPLELARIAVDSHTLAADRAAHVVYNAGFASGQLGGTEIIDARDPDHIRLAKTWMWPPVAKDGTPVQPTGCHDITVVSATKRGYCAAQVQTLVWDLTDPFNPVVLTAVNDPLVPHHNTAFPIRGGKVLVIGDEEGACAPRAAGAAAPAGALWFYDLERSPAQLLGYLSMPSPSVSGGCAPHFGTEVGNGTGYVSFGWFGAGLVLVDARQPASPRIVSQTTEGGSASAAQYYRGFVFVAGQKGGLQVALPE